MRGTLTVIVREEETFVSMVTHEEIQNRECVLLEARENEQAWLAVKIPEDENTPWHRVQTSPVKFISEEDICLTCNPPIYQHKLCIYTENSIYCITKESKSNNIVGKEFKYDSTYKTITSNTETVTVECSKQDIPNEVFIG